MTIPSSDEPVGDHSVGSSPFSRVLRSFRRERIATCKECPRYIKAVKMCEECGCFIPAKSWFKGQSCPLGKWRAIE